MIEAVVFRRAKMEGSLERILLYGIQLRTPNFIYVEIFGEQASLQRADASAGHSDRTHREEDCGCGVLHQETPRFPANERPASSK
jgi:hypothetical protein